MLRSVLVVDDDACFRELASRLLAAEGHQVIGEAGTVKEALGRTAPAREDSFRNPSSPTRSCQNFLKDAEQS
ncbi:MAG: hypothetical protein ABI775_07815 [Pseudonocardiales bacterium]